MKIKPDQMDGINPGSASVPKYVRLYRSLREDIIRGHYPYGRKLPSKRMLAERFGCSVMTAEHALQLFSEEGYVRSRERSGTVVIFQAEDGFSLSRERPVEKRPPPASASDSFSAFPFSVFARTIRRVLNQYPESLLRKSPPAGVPEFREAIRQYLARNRGIHVEADQIIIGSGAEFLYGQLVTLLGREQIFALESPSYRQIEQVYRAEGVTCVLLPLGEDGILSTALSATSARVLHVTPFRSFPTGVTASASKRFEYIRWTQARPDRFLIEDDFESEFSLSRKREEPLFALAPPGRIIYLNTFSRTISPALRVGYMVLPPNLVQRYVERLAPFSCTVPTLEQYLLTELLESGDFERHINRVRRRTAGRRGGGAATSAGRGGGAATSAGRR